MTLRRIATVLGLLAFALPAFVAAQGLGDAAAREKAKREAAKKAGEAKVFTNEDLAQGRPPGTPAEGAASSSTSSPPEGASPDRVSQESAPEADRRTEEQPYIEALAAAQSQVAQVEARIRELQAKLNPMSTTFIYGDFGGLGGDKVAEEAEVKAELAQAEGELAAARQAVVDATRAHQDLRQGRPTGPPVPR